MKNRIDQLFADTGRTLLMTHLVAGFPSPAGSRELAETLLNCGADLLEIQIPFSDPLADGPTIMAANQQALAAGTAPSDALCLIESLAGLYSAPLLLMTYANIPCRLGWTEFADACAQAGAAGVIVPDLPADEPGQNLRRILKKRNIHFIEVISPGMSAKRLATVCWRAKGFVYATLRVGITGAGLHIASSGLDFLQQVKTTGKLPLAAGFGISRPEHLDLLKGKAAAVVIGSRIINLFQSGGLPAVSDFITLCRARLDRN